MALLDPRTNNYVLEIDLRSCVINMSLDRQRLDVGMDIKSEDSRVTLYNGTSYQTVNKDDGCSLIWRASKMSFSELVGIVDSISIPLSNGIKRISLPDEVDSVRIARGRMIFNLWNFTPAPVRYIASITAVNEHNGASRTLPMLLERIEPGFNRFVFPDTVGMLSIIPNIFSLKGSADFGTVYFPDQNYIVNTSTSDQGLQGEMVFESPLKGIMEPIDKIDSVEVIDYQLDYPIQKVDISIGVTNTIPLSGDLTFLLGNHPDSMSEISQTGIPLGTIVNGRMEKPFVQRYEIPIAEEFYSIIKRQPIYAQRILHYDGTDGQEVWLYAEDSLKIQAALTIYYQVDPGGNSGK
jgi:hypothetical protein